MKLRIVKKQNYFYPQVYKEPKYSYQNVWHGFTTGYGTKNIRFTEKNLAIQFIKILQQGWNNAPAKKNSKSEVVYSL